MGSLWIELPVPIEAAQHICLPDGYPGREDPSNLHITVVHLGEVAEVEHGFITACTIAQMISTVAMPLEISTYGIHFFGDYVAYTKVAGNVQLKSMRDAAINFVELLDITTADLRPYTPHVTIAKGEAVKGMKMGHKPPPVRNGTFNIDRIVARTKTQTMEFKL